MDRIVLYSRKFGMVLTKSAVAAKCRPAECRPAADQLLILNHRFTYYKESIVKGQGGNVGKCRYEKHLKILYKHFDI